ncbi:MAG TPA: transporter [Xanthomonadaceae bacterium]|nr:transporter [Xanthomonadaceae bacterium]
MKRIATGCALLLVLGGARAADGLSLGVGVDYSSGDYGTGTTTDILSVPFTAKYASGNWSWKASLPWMRVSGNANVVPGLGEVTNSNPRGRGRGNGGGTPTATDTGTASGVGDLRLAGTYSFDTGTPLGIDLTANAKIATADENKGLGTGANDYGLAVDLYRAFGRTTVFGGAGYTVLGKSDYIDVNGVANANVGASWKLERGDSVGAMYEWRQAAATGASQRSELTGFYTLGAGEGGKLQLYATAGLSDGSPAWGGGVSYTHAF